MIPAENIKKFINELEIILNPLQVDALVWNKFVTIAREYLGHKIDKVAQNNITKEIAIMWNIHDVKSIRPDLTDDQASDVLIYAQKNHDAVHGINWSTLDCIADELYPIDN